VLHSAVMMRLSGCRLGVVTASVFSALLFVSPVAHAAGHGVPNRTAAVARSSAVGYDISYPQCGSAYPGGQAFGIVGVNGGLANNANRCLGSELSWAVASPGLRSPAQPPASLYINTADPGPAPGVTDWPRSGRSAAYGSCHGGWSKACAYAYGRTRAEYSYRLVKAVSRALARHAPWWLDVEISSSWATGKRRNHGGLNRAAIRGFIVGLRASGARGPIGIYSLAHQWSQITGLTARMTAAAFGGRAPRDWIGGTASITQAKKACASRGFTGVRPTLAQYRSGNFDADLRCR
jgi:hypothetical protein